MKKWKEVVDAVIKFFTHFLSYVIFAVFTRVCVLGMLIIDLLSNCILHQDDALAAATAVTG